MEYRILFSESSPSPQKSQGEPYLKPCIHLNHILAIEHQVANLKRTMEQNERAITASSKDDRQRLQLFVVVSASGQCISVKST